MEPFDRQPPRFVPTLTDVVPLGLPIKKPSEGGAPQPASEAAPEVPVVPEVQVPVGSEPALGTMDFAASQAEPFPFEDAQPEPEPVPAAQSLHADAVAVPVQGAAADSLPPEPMVLSISAAELHQMLVQRILERVQPVLEAQLQEVVANVVLAHAEAMAHHLQNAVEEVVHHAVVDAMAQEQLQSHLQFLDDEIPPLS